MAEEDAQPWDLRLVNWMSRGSNAAAGGASSPRGAALFGVTYVALALWNALAGGRAWIAWAVLGVLWELMAVSRWHARRKPIRPDIPPDANVERGA